MKCSVVCVLSRSLGNSVRLFSSLAGCHTNSSSVMAPVLFAARSLPFLNCHKNLSIFKWTGHQFGLPRNISVMFPSSPNLVSKLHADRKPKFVSSRLQKTMKDSNINKGEGVQAGSRRLTISTEAILKASPLSLQPYLKLIRFDRPIGTWLLFLPCTWSISLAAPAGHLPDIRMLALFALGSFSMRSAACTINDIWDKDYDARVARTRDRPLACGQISQLEALTFLALPLSVSLAILLTFNWNTVALGAFSIIPCVIYPLMKRFTYWPQAFLGLTLNWGVMIAWTALHGSLDIPGFVLYLSCVFWTMIYDTIYAHQDKSDDILVGVKSTALKFGNESKIWLSLFATCVTGGLTTAGYLCNQPSLYYGGVSIVMAHLAYQIYSVNLDDAESCGKTFRANRNLGLVFWAFVVGAGLLSDSGTQIAASVMQ